MHVLRTSLAVAAAMLPLVKSIPARALLKPQVVVVYPRSLAVCDTNSEHNICRISMLRTLRMAVHIVAAVVSREQRLAGLFTKNHSKY